MARNEEKKYKKHITFFYFTKINQQEFINNRCGSDITLKELVEIIVKVIRYEGQHILIQQAIQYINKINGYQ